MYLEIFTAGLLFKFCGLWINYEGKRAQFTCILISRLQGKWNFYLLPSDSPPTAAEWRLRWWANSADWLHFAHKPVCIWFWIMNLESACKQHGRSQVNPCRHSSDPGRCTSIHITAKPCRHTNAATFNVIKSELVFSYESFMQPIMF